MPGRDTARFSFAVYISYEIHDIAALSFAVELLRHKTLQHAVRLQISVASFLLTPYVVITPILYCAARVTAQTMELFKVNQ